MIEKVNYGGQKGKLRKGKEKKENVNSTSLNKEGDRSRRDDREVEKKMS